MSPSARATVIGGVLAATGELRADLTAAEVLDSVAISVGPATVWSPIVPAQHGWERYDLALSGVPAAWAVPDPGVLAVAGAVLEAAWTHVQSLVIRTPWMDPVLRFTTRSIEEVEVLAALGNVDDLAITSFIPAAPGEWRWHWPLRVGVVASRRAQARVDALRAGRYAEHVDVFVVEQAQPDPVDLFVVGVDDLAPTVRAGAVVVIGPPVDRVALGDRLTLGERLAPGAVVAVPADELGWFDDLVKELSHDRPLDAAVGLARSDAVVIGDPHFMAATALRNWTRVVAERAAASGDVVLATALRPIAENYLFNSEQEAGRDTTDAIRAAERDGTSRHLDGDTSSRSATAPPPSIVPPDGELPVAPPRVPTDEVTPPERRGLVARVTDPDGNVRADGFLAGRAHRLQLRIAADAGAGEVAAVEPLVSPTPGTAVKLKVTVAVEGSRAKAQTKQLTYPATGDGPWTTPLRITAPRSADTMTVFVTVQWKGRVIQSAVLSGPVVSAGTAPGAPAMTLDVDVSSDGLASDQRTGADATFVVLPGAGSAPVLIDSASGIPIDSTALDAANNDIRRVLIETFQRPPGSLTDAARPLAELAVHGASLRESLMGKDGGFHDDADWIHITSFGVAAVPFELIYTHVMPDLDQTVRVCAPALGGQAACAADCADRARRDRVCPFGFWGTTKTIERRQHSPDRNDPTPSEQREVAVRTGGVVAVTPEANAEDATAADRIAAAVAGFVTAGSSVATPTWKDLQTAVASPRHVVCLVTHTVEPEDRTRTLDVKLQLGAEAIRLTSVDRTYINPTPLQPGPIVLALGCDTAIIHASFASFVARLHTLGAEIVVSAISQIPGKEVADFVERLMHALDQVLATPGEHRFGSVLTAARRQTLLTGDVLALALTATGDGDVRLASA